MGTLEILQSALDGMAAQIIGTNAPAVGDPVVAGLTPPLDAIEIIEALTGQLDLVWVAKDVLFGTSDLEPSFDPVDLDAATTGAQPAGISPTGTLVPLAGVPGNLGQLRGTIPVGLGTKLPVTAEVTWRVLDAAGAPLAPTEFSAPGGLGGPEITVFFAPGTAELVANMSPPAPLLRQLEATVTLTAGGVTVGPQVLPLIPVLVPVLLIPVVLGAFVHTNFQIRYSDDDGAVLLVVPTNSPLNSASQLQSTLNTLQAALGNLTAFPTFAAFLLGVSELATAVAAHNPSYIQFRSTQQISNLNQITLINRPWYQNDTEAEDELSSLILLGPAGRAVDFFKRRNFNNTQYTLTTGATFYAIVRSLHANNPAVEGGTGSNPGEDLGDELSSLRFV